MNDLRDDLREVWMWLRGMRARDLAGGVVLGLLMLAALVISVWGVLYGLAYCGAPQWLGTPAFFATLGVWLAVIFRRELLAWLRTVPEQVRWWVWVWSRDHPPRDVAEIEDLEMARAYLESEGQR